MPVNNYYILLFSFVYHEILDAGTLLVDIFGKCEMLDERITKQNYLSCISIDSLLFSMNYLRKKN